MPLKVLVFLGLLASLPANADSLTFEAALITKSSASGDWHSMLNRSTGEWCANLHHNLQFSTYDAATVFQNLPDGLWQCSGKYVAVPYQPVAQAFEISNCVSVDPVALRKTCH